MYNDDDNKYANPGGLFETWSRSRILGLIFLLITANFFVQILTQTVYDNIFVAVLFGAVWGVFLPLFLLSRNPLPQLKHDLRLNRCHPLLLLAAGLMAVCALVPTSLLAELSLRLTPMDPQWLDLLETNLPRTPTAIVIAFVAGAIVAPLAEEIIFRGLLHRLTADIWGALPAAIISSLVFGLIHGEPWFLFGLIGIGLVLAFVYETTRSLTACWVTHMVHNAVSLGLMLSRPELQAEPSEIGSSDLLWGGVSMAGLVALGWFMKNVHRGNTETDAG